MLIYEKDNFFKPHQDSEKEDNMVATMVVVLPTKHKGGELIIDHKGEKKILKGAGVLKNISCFSFYADCFHEVKEVTDGYRVSLTFNLILENYKGSVGSLYEKDFYSRLYNAFERYLVYIKKNSISCFLIDIDLIPKILSVLLDGYSGFLGARLSENGQHSGFPRL